MVWLCSVPDGIFYSSNDGSRNYLCFVLPSVHPTEFSRFWPGSGWEVSWLGALKDDFVVVHFWFVLYLKLASQESSGNQVKYTAFFVWAWNEGGPSRTALVMKTRELPLRCSRGREGLWHSNSSILVEVLWAHCKKSSDTMVKKTLLEQPI